MGINFSKSFSLLDPVKALLRDNCRTLLQLRQDMLTMEALGDTASANYLDKKEYAQAVRKSIKDTLTIVGRIS